MDDLTLELIEKHLEGKLSPEEQTAFEQRIIDDAAFKNEVRIYQALMTGIDGAGVDAFEEKVKGWEAKHKTSSTSTKGKVVQMKATEKPKNNRRFYIAAAIIALLLIPVSMFLFNQGPGNDAVFAEAFEPYEGTFSVGKTGKKNPYARGMSFYRQGSYQNAINAFTKYINSSKARPRQITTAKFYLGISLLAENKSKAAIDSFEQVVKAEQSPYKEASEWYIALIEMKDKNATSKLTAIANQDNHEFHQAALDVLQKLE